MLITSRETRRWVIPKGWPMSGRSGPETASIEAFEEAGIKGRPLREPIGSYRYSKRMGRGADLPCEVTVFPVWIAAQLEDWPERPERESGLFTRAQAAARVDEVELAALILALPDTGSCTAIDGGVL